MNRILITTLLAISPLALFPQSTVTDTIDIEEVVVTGTKIEVAGLFVTGRGNIGFGVATGAAGKLNMRGLGGNPTTQVLFLLDGQPQFMGIMGHHLPDAYVSSDVEKVEVIRGPVSFLYGSNAFGDD